MKSLGSGREKLRDPSSKPQASSNKRQARHYDKSDKPQERQATKRQATRATSHKQQSKRQASSTKRFQKPGARFITHKFRFKLQATSCKLPDTGTLIKFWHLEAGILNLPVCKLPFIILSKICLSNLPFIISYF
jgi:hypothetical protein